MGVWGAGTFQSDAAADFLDEQVERLCAFIREDLKSAKTDRILERQMLAALACLRAILSQTVVDEEAAAMIDYREVESWRDEYLKWFDSVSDSLEAPQENVARLRQNAESEFSKLLQHLRRA
jgi:hypothetical protein